MSSKPNFGYERKLWQKGKLVVGIDEVGRGAWAGPVVVAAVAWPQLLKFKTQKSKVKTTEGLGIDDSKRLTPKKREILAKEIKKYALAWDITEVSASVINKIGIGKATEKGMRKAVRDITKLLNGYIVELNEEKQHNNITINNQQFHNLFVLVDYYHVPYLRGIGKSRQLGIKKGDQKSLSIAAASILAKVYRDKLMRRLGRKYSKYHWGENKGYGTEIHQRAILRYGLSRYHRKQFVKTWLH